MITLTHLLIAFIVGAVIVLIGGGACCLAVWFGTKIQRAKAEDEMYAQLAKGNGPRPDGPPESASTMGDLGYGPGDIDMPDSQQGAIDEVEADL